MVRVKVRVRVRVSRKDLSGMATRSSMRQKYGQDTRALLTGPFPGTRQRLTAAYSAARSSPCAATMHIEEVAAKLARQCASRLLTPLALPDRA